MKKSFYIVDDHEMLRLGIISYIENNSGWICIGSTGDHNQVMQELEKLSAEGRLPSVLISDLNFCFHSPRGYLRTGALKAPESN